MFSVQQAVRWGLLLWNPCDAVQPPRVPRVERDVLRADQVAKLFAAAKGDRLEALYVLAVTSGMRLGEMFGLQWPCVDLEQGLVQVRKTLIEMSGKVYLSEPKTAKSRRSIWLPDLATAVLRSHRARMVAEGLADVPWVFCDRRGEPLRRGPFHFNEYKPLLAKAGLPKMRFHDLRHTSATLLLCAEVHPKVVHERLGHSQIGVTMDTYSHVLPSMQREAAAKLDELLGKKPGDA